MTNARAVRYHRLASAEKDPASAAVLQMLADEAERGVLHVSEPAIASATPLIVTDDRG